MPRTTSWNGSKVKYVGPKEKRGMVSRSKKSVWSSKVKYVGPKEKRGMVKRRSRKGSNFGRPKYSNPIKQREYNERKQERRSKIRNNKKRRNAQDSKHIKEDFQKIKSRLSKFF